MKFLAIEIENQGVNSDQYMPLLKDESLKVLELYEKGVIREIFFDQSHCAVLILECTNTEEVEMVLSDLPLVSNGLIHFDIRELKPYNGFSRLIAT